MKPNTRPNNIHDRVYRSNLMKMNLFQRHVVHPRFRFPQLPKNSPSPISHSRRQLRLLQNLQDRAKRPVLRLILRHHLHIGRRHPVLPNLLRRQFPSRNLQPAQFRTQMLDRATRIHQRAKSHIPANPAKAIKIGKFHGRPSRAQNFLLKNRVPECRLILSALPRTVKQWASMSGIPTCRGRACLPRRGPSHILLAPHRASPAHTRLLRPVHLTMHAKHRNLSLSLPYPFPLTPNSFPFCYI